MGRQAGPITLSFELDAVVPERFAKNCPRLVPGGVVGGTTVPGGHKWKATAFWSTIAPAQPLPHLPKSSDHGCASTASGRFDRDFDVLGQPGCSRRRRLRSLVRSLAVSDRLVRSPRRKAA